MQATLQEDIPDFLLKLREVDTSGVLGVGVARVRTSGSRMQAWITYGGPDGTGALNLEGGTLFQYFYAVVRTRGNNRAKELTRKQVSSKRPGGFRDQPVTTGRRAIRACRTLKKEFSRRHRTGAACGAPTAPPADRTIGRLKLGRPVWE
eukprot:scaffold3049_cov132-Isochrysis_galbana.AAC.1